MRVYISVDMEGVAGVVHGDQTTRAGGHDYGIARELMTLEANAAVLGAFDAGATDVLVNDSHGDMRNLLLDKMDPRAQVLTGSLKAFSMAEGLNDGRFDVALFVGYHAGAGAENAILDHTYRGAVVSRVRVNGKVLNEAGLNALVAGAAGTPIGLVTGDETTCRECRELLGDVDTVVVKWAVGRLAARSLHPEEARRRIREGAARAARDPKRFRPFTMEPPYRLEMDLQSAAAADAAALMPGAARAGGRTVRFDAATPDLLFRAMLCLVRLGGVGIS
jgi:D-amino peptidase